MKIRDHLDKEQLKKLNKYCRPKKKKRKEKVNWHEMMNTNMQTLKRGRGGAFKRK